MRILAILLLVLSISCATKKGKEASKNNTQTTNFSYVTLNRGACYGTCPVFEVTIQNDGSVVYYGKSNVDYIGNFTGNLSTEKTTQLFDKLADLNWESFPDNFPIDNYDFPQFHISVGNENNLRKIKGNSNADEQLVAVTTFIDELLIDLTLAPTN